MARVRRIKIILIIAALPRFHFLMDVQEEGIFFMRSTASTGELRRFGMT